MKYPRGITSCQKVMSIKGITCDQKQTIITHEGLQKILYHQYRA